MRNQNMRIYMFYDRVDAAEKLVKQLDNYKNLPDVVVLAMPRGGVVTGKIVADKLHVPLDIIITRKITAPGNQEYAIGAVAESGDPVLNDEVIGTMGITPDYLDKEIANEREEIDRRLNLYRGNNKSLDLKDKIVILVDDGIATGLTVQAAIEYLKTSNAKKIIIAVPVIPEDTVKQLKNKVDDLIYLDAPEQFFAVGQFYDQFEQVSDDAVVELLR